MVSRADIRVGRRYQNKLGTVTREVLEFVTLPNQANKDAVKYRVVWTAKRRRVPGPNTIGYVGVCTKTLFTKWAIQEVVP